MTNLLSLLALLPFANTNPVNLCTSIHAEEITGGAYQIPVMAATPGPGKLDHFYFVATERFRKPAYSPSVRFALYTSLPDAQTIAAFPFQSAHFYQEYSTNNGLKITQFDGSCLSGTCETNVYLIDLPVNVSVPSMTWAAVWFPSLGNWAIPPFMPPTGSGGIVKVYQSCKWHKASGGWGYYFKPLYEVGGANQATGYTGYFSVPYWLAFLPALSATRTGTSVTFSWPETNATNLVLRSNSHVIQITTNTVTLNPTNQSELFWLEER